MANHRLSSPGTNHAGNPIAVCRTCGTVRTYPHLGKMVCENRLKELRGKKRLTDRKRDVRARKAAEKATEELAAYLWRFIVFERAERRCEFCGAGPFERGSFGLHAHHLIKRSQSARLQLDHLNGAAACQKRCHIAADRDPIRALAIIDEKRRLLGGKLLQRPMLACEVALSEGVSVYLFRERRNPDKPDFDVQLAELKRLAAQYGWEE